MNYYVHNWVGHQINVSVPMQHFIVANMLRHWYETVMVIQKEPNGRFVGKNYLDHPYTAKVKMVCHNCDILEGTFQS